MRISILHKLGVVVLYKVSFVNFDKMNSLAKENGLKMAYFCDLLGKSRHFITDVKNGKSYFTKDQLQIIADKLNTTTEYLTDQTDQKEKPVDQMTDEQLDNAFIHLLGGLTADDIKKVEAFIAGLKAGKE